MMFAPHVMPDWLIKMPTAWAGQKRRSSAKVPGLVVYGKNHEEEREKGKKTAMQACSAGQEAQLTELLNLLLWR